MGFQDGLAKTPFIAVVNEELCDYCGDCLKTCNVKCIGLAKEHRTHIKADRRAKIDPHICLGCSACVSACEKEAISLEPRDDYRVPPKNKGWMFTRILWEKGRLSPFVLSRIKRKLGKFTWR